jgi:trans-aconitate 2-methyltransferase
VLEETRLCSQWAGSFSSFRDPYLHLTPEEYGALAERSGFKVAATRIAAKSWDFQSRSAFMAFGSVTFVEWTQHLPQAERPAFATDVLDRYRKAACDAPGEENFFRFYQMDVTLVPR